MTNDDTKISKIAKKMFICLIDNISVWICSPCRGWSPAFRTDPFNGSIQPVRKLDRLLLNSFYWTVWMAATTPPCLKINFLYRTDCVDPHRNIKYEQIRMILRQKTPNNIIVIVVKSTNMHLHFGIINRVANMQRTI